jgi:hypothetical protein
LCGGGLFKSTIAADNRCFYCLGQIFRSRAASAAVEIKLCTTVVKPVVSEVKREL